TCGSARLPVPLFVFLARATGARVIATDLGAVTGNRCAGRRRGGLADLLFGLFTDAGQLLVLELHALGQLLGLLTQPGFFLGRIFAAHLHVAQHPNGVGLDRLEHLLEQIEGLALVFLLGVFLGIAAQVDTLAQ